MSKYRLAAVKELIFYVRKENALFQDLPHFEVTFVSSILPSTSKIENLQEARVRKLLPDPLTGLVMRAPYSTTSFIELSDLERLTEEFDLINCFEIFSFVSRQCSQIAKKRNKKMTVCCFSTFPSIPLYRIPPYTLNIGAVKEKADLFIPFTRRASNCLRSLSIPKEKIKQVYPGVDIQRFSPPTNRRGEHEKSRILFVGSLFPEKGLSVLLPAFSRLCKEDGDVELWICVSDTEVKGGSLCRSYARKYPIRILGNVDYSHIHEIYKECDIFCHPSFDRSHFGLKIWEEEFVFSLVEAMACGLPVIASDCGAMPEIVGPANIIVPQKSIEVLYLALKRLLRNDDYRKELVVKNRARAIKEFDLDKQRLKMDDALRQLF